ncbi:MAG: Na(+)/H(+) antiporter subunit D [Thermodesulfobacteriota bacterium]
MTNPVPPFIIFILGAMLVPILRGRLRQIFLLLLPVIGLIDIINLPAGTSWVYDFLGYELIFARVDKLSLVVGYIFVIIGFLGIIYSLHVEEAGQHVAALMYVGSSLGVVFAGDYFTLFIFWEIMAAASVFLVWYRKEKEALDAGFRYVLMHLFGGALLLAGIIMHTAWTGSIAIRTPLHELPFWLIMFGFGLNTAFIPLHTWLPDAYPQGTITGSVFMCVYTTKTGVYVLARCFPNIDFVAYMGGAMAVYGVVFALAQNDARRLLSYHIMSQVGYMVAGVGVGGALGVDGGIAHVVNHILYKGLLFMCMGSVIYMTGKRKLTEMGGLARYMPVTCIACIIASLSISGGPGFNGFVSKGMVIASASADHKPILELMLTLASVGTFLSFVKLCYFAFFAKNEEITAKEAPLNMQVAMVATAFLCVFLGVYPQPLLELLPYPVPVDYHTFTPGHILATIQIFLLSGLVFMVARNYFAPHKGIVLDVDLFYRMGGRIILWFCEKPLNALRSGVQSFLTNEVEGTAVLSRNPYRAGRLIKSYFRGDPKDKYEAVRNEPYNVNSYRIPIGVSAGVATIFLFLLTLIYFAVGG